jgi:hypothetical protein
VLNIVKKKNIGFFSIISNSYGNDHFHCDFRWLRVFKTDDNPPEWVPSEKTQKASQTSNEILQTSKNCLCGMIRYLTTGLIKEWSP